MFSLKKDYIKSKPNQLLIFLNLYSDKISDYYNIPYNPNISEEMFIKLDPLYIRTIKDTEYSFDDRCNRSSDENITVEDVLGFSRNWCYSHLSKNPQITWNIIQTETQMDWDRRRFSENPNLKISIIRNNPNIVWHWSAILTNEFLYNNVVFKREYKIDTKRKIKIIFNLLKTKLLNDLITIVDKYISAY
jgi:hypothetical protein